MSLGSLGTRSLSLLYNIIYDTRKHHLTKRKNKLKKTQIRKNLKIIRSVKKPTIINFQTPGWSNIDHGKPTV